MPVNLEFSFSPGTPAEVISGIMDEFRKEIPGFVFNYKEAQVQGAQGVLTTLVICAVDYSIHHTFKSLAEKELRFKFTNIWGGYIKKNKLPESEIKINVQGMKDPNAPFHSIDREHTHVLLAGCSKFQHAHSVGGAIPPVKGNLNTLEELLIDKKYFNIPKGNVTVSHNDTNDVVKDHLHYISMKKGIKTFIFYYAGHGLSIGNDYYLAAYNTKKNKDYVGHGIDKKDIRKILLQSPAQQKIVIIDACYSGMLAQGGAYGMFETEVKGSYILTSSSADELSFYDKQQAYTFFTNALINSIKNGIDNNSAMISLHDIYTEVAEQLKEKKKNEPTYKNDLNIDPSKFTLSSNAAFTPEKQKAKPYDLMAHGKWDEAEAEFKRLIKVYPNDIELRKAADSLTDNKLYVDYVSKGDINYYSEPKNYEKAIGHYRNALGIKEEIAVREKLNSCLHQLGIPPEHAIVAPEAPQLPGTSKEKKWIRATILSIIITITCVVSGHYVEEWLPKQPWAIRLSAWIHKPKSMQENDTAQNTINPSPKYNNPQIIKADSAWDKKDFTTALETYKSFKDSLLPDRLVNIARLYENGNKEANISKDGNEALTYYKLACGKGDTTACSWLAEAYFKGKNIGGKEIEKSYTSALDYSKAGAMAGDRFAMLSTGKLYYFSKEWEIYSSATLQAHPPDWPMKNRMDSAKKYLQMASMKEADDLLNQINLYEKQHK